MAEAAVAFDPPSSLMRDLASGGLQGRLVADAPLKKLTWFRTGGAADILFEPKDRDDLARFMRLLPADCPLTIIGVGSNLLVRDGGVRGAVVRLGRGFQTAQIEGDILHAGAGAMDIHVARLAADHGLAGLEFLVGIPGTLGGAVRMNAGAYGGELGDCFIEASGIDRMGCERHFTPADLAFQYRKSALPADVIITDVWLKGSADAADAVRARTDAIVAERNAAQPTGQRTGGSTFKNPPDTSAWKLIDKVGGRGLCLGDAQISEKHCNFLINKGQASAADLEALGELVRERVRTREGVDLEWEVKRIGEPAGHRDTGSRGGGARNG